MRREPALPFHPVLVALCAAALVALVYCRVNSLGLWDPAVAGEQISLADRLLQQQQAGNSGGKL